MLSLIRSRGSAGSLGAYGVTVPAVALGLWAALAIARTDARVLAAAPLALAVALSAAYGGVGPGLFALFQASLGIDYFLIEPGRLFHDLSAAQGAALILFIAGWSFFSLLTGVVVRQTHRIRQACDTAESSSVHAARMTQLISALAQARTPRAAIEAAVQEALYATRANAGALLLVSADDRTATVVRAVGYTEGQIADEVGLADAGPLGDAVGRGVPVIMESRAAKVAEYPPASESRTDAFQALAVVPLLIGSRVVAVLRLDFSEPRVFTQHDREYLLALAHGGAQALDRTWQLEVAERGRADAEHLRAQADLQLAERAIVEQALRASETRYRSLAARTSRLHALSAALSEAVTIGAVARAVVTHGRTVVGATAAEVLLLAGDNAHLERLDAEPVDGGVDSTDVLLDDGVCATAAVDSGRPVFVASFDDWQRRFWRSASIAADGGYQSSATLPLLVEGAPIGVLAFHFTVPVNFDDDYQALLVSVAQHCAQAIDRARLYESTQRARAEAERANRIKDEFVSIVSHELRTPLNAILGWTTMLQSGALPPEKSARALRSVHENASRQARLIDELLDFSRVTSGRASLELEDVDVRELIRGVAESMIPSAVARTVELHLSAVPPVHVTGDRRRLEQVFFNLIDNALKFTPPGGRIAIDVRVGNGQVNVQVSDNGDGIDPDFLPHVFDRFRQADSTTSRTHGGLGLGMSIARQLVEAHNGQISAASEGKGCGSTFTVQLPTLASPSESAAQESVAPVSHDQTPRPAVRLDGVRVLVVDDEADAREMMAAALESSGAEVQIAGSTRSAVDILERTVVDVLLSDIAMPEEDGFALIRHVRGSPARHVAAIPAAAVTAFSGIEARDRALAAGFQLHLAKPLEPVDLVRAVERLANRCSVQGA